MTQSINVTTDTLIKLFGSLDEYARLIEKGMGVVLRLQDGVLKIIGDDSAVERAAGLVNSLIALMGKGYEITRDKVLSSIDLALMDKPDDIISRRKLQLQRRKSYGKRKIYKVPHSWAARVCNRNQEKYARFRHRSCRYGKNVSGGCYGRGCF